MYGPSDGKGRIRLCTGPPGPIYGLSAEDKKWNAAAVRFSMDCIDIYLYDILTFEILPCSSLADGTRFAVCLPICLRLTEYAGVNMYALQLYHRFAAQLEIRVPVRTKPAIR